MNNLKKLPVYLREFGALRGAHLWSAVERAEHKGPERRIRLKVPGFDCPIYLRDTVADCSIFWQCLVRRQYDTSAFPQHANLLARYEQVLADGRRPLIIDAGGNIGLASVWFAHRFPEARIVVIEPDAGNLELLHLNTAGFGDRVEVVKGGVWNERGTLRIVNPDSGSAAYRVEFSDSINANGINAYTIDDLCRIGGEDAPLIVKLDIEGAQAQLFSSNTDWVGRTALISLELDDWLFPGRGTSRSFFSCISSYPYEYLLGGESIFCFRAGQR